MKSLENIYNLLREIKLLNKFKDYKSLEIYFTEKPSGKNITKFHETLIKSSIDYKPSRADFFENIIIPLLIKNKLSENKIIEYVFLCLKDDGNLTQINTLEGFLNSISKEDNFNKFMYFLQKTEYVKSDKKNEIINVLEKYNLYISERINFFKKSNVLEAVDILLNESESFILTEKLDKRLIILFDNFYNYIQKDCKAEIKNKDLFVDLLNKVNSLIPIFKKYQTLSESSKIIKNKSLIIKQKIEEEKAILISFLEIESITKKTPQELFVKDLSKLITAKDNHRAYSDFISIGNLICQKNEAPILINLFNKGGLFFETTENEERYLTLIQNIVLRLLFSLPKGHVQIKIIDEDYGRSFQHLLNLPKEIIGSHVYYDDSMVLKLFEEAKKRDSDIVFNKLKSSYNNLIEYNKVNEIDFVPIELYVISNFPNNFNDTFIKYISNQIKKGSRTGSYYIFTHNSSNVNNEKNISIINEIISHLPSIKFDLKSINYQGKSNPLDSVKCRFDDEILISDNLLTQYFNQKSVLNEKNNIESKKEDNINSAEEIKIQIGTKANQVKAYLTLGETSGVHHGIVCGTTGSGKSVLLHQIITAGATKYKADELQFILLDYKEGTGFQDYKKLPHARILSENADLDFGYETLKFITNLVKERADLFKRHNTKNITEFRNKTEQKCPRILIIIDEFQVLLSGSNQNRKIHEEIKILLEDIVRLGRSFGIHLLLSTQTPSGVKWNSSTMENISIRIGLRMSTEAENTLFKHQKPIASQFTEKFGQAVYNDKSGVQSESVIFTVNNLDEKKIPFIVGIIEIDAVKTNTMPLERTIYVANSYEKYNDTPIGKAKFAANSFPIKIKIGKAANIKMEDVTINMEPNDLKNIIILGRQENGKKELVSVILNKYIESSKSDTIIYIYNEDENKTEYYKTTFSNNTQIVIINKNQLAEKTIELASDIDHNTVVNSRILFIIEGSVKLGGLGKNVVDPSKLIRQRDVFQNLLSKGNVYNISFIVIVNEKDDFKKAFDFESDKGQFAYSISLQGLKNKNVSGSESKDLSDSYELNENMAILYDRDKNQENKFNLIQI